MRFPASWLKVNITSPSTTYDLSFCLWDILMSANKFNTQVTLHRKYTKWNHIDVRHHAADNERADKIIEAEKKTFFLCNNRKHELCFKKEKEKKRKADVERNPAAAAAAQRPSLSFWDVWAQKQKRPSEQRARGVSHYWQDSGSVKDVAKLYSEAVCHPAIVCRPARCVKGK